MFGYDKDSDENKNKIEQLEEQIEVLENKIAQIMEVLDIQEDYSDDDSIDEDSDEDFDEE